MTRPAILQRSAYRVMPWRNGAGTTAEIAVGPPGAGGDDFAWRVAMADLPASGPFSAFPGIDRTLYLLPGPPVELVVDGVTHALAGLDAVSFAGEAETSCVVAEGPTRDVNVMTRRDRATHAHALHVVERETAIALAGDDALVFVADGAVTIDGVALAAGDSAVWRGRATGAVSARPAGGQPSAALIVACFRVSPA